MPTVCRERYSGYCQRVKEAVDAVMELCCTVVLRVTAVMMALGNSG